MAIAPLLAGDCRQHALGMHLANARQVLQQPVLLRRELRREIGVLRGAAAADAEVRAAREAAARRLAEQAGGAAEIELAPLGENAHRGALAGQRALDEHHLAVGLARHAAPLGIQRFNLEDQFFQRERNSPQCGRFCFSRNARSSAVSRSYCSFESAQRISWKRR